MNDGDANSQHQQKIITSLIITWANFTRRACGLITCEMHACSLIQAQRLTLYTERNAKWLNKRAKKSILQTFKNIPLTILIHQPVSLKPTVRLQYRDLGRIVSHCPINVSKCTVRTKSWKENIEAKSTPRY